MKKPRNTGIVRKIAIIGGGRWAKVWCRTALRVLGQAGHIHIVTPRNARGMASWLSREGMVSRVCVYQSIEDLLLRVSPDAAIICNLPSEHAVAARRLLGANVHCLVEKPFTRTSAEARELIREASRRNLSLCVGHEFHFAGWVKQAGACAGRFFGRVRHAELYWCDPWKQNRYGETRVPDFTTNVTLDLFPHVMTIIEGVLGRASARMGAVCLEDPNAVSVRYSHGACNVSAHLSRNAPVAYRALQLRTDLNEQLVIDFTSEPNRIEWNEEPVWLSAIDDTRPLDHELAEFIASIANRQYVPVHCASRTEKQYGMLEQVAREIENVTLAQLGDYLSCAAAEGPPSSVVSLLREHLAADLLKSGLVGSPKDLFALNRYACYSARVAHCVASDPFVSQQAIALQTHVSAQELSTLNGILRESTLVQRAIIEHGSARAYWRNTILPVEKTGSLQSVINAQTRYPMRVGIYPGRSCMFRCVFCGSKKGARYPVGCVENGNETFRALFANAPKDDPDRFYISGGVEPLTNPEIGEIVHAGARHGFRLCMYTNGYLLTPALLQKHPSLWELDKLRISLYGVSRESAHAVTGCASAYETVSRNATDFLRLRNSRKSSARLAFNFVILPGQEHEVIEVLEFIARMNREVGGRQVDSLSLREDFTAALGRGLREKNRLALQEVFAEVNERIQQSDLSDLSIDYGYALDPVTRGISAGDLKLVGSDCMRRKGFPQVSVVVDIRGDVYLYREAGFPEREGAKRYRIGTVSASKSLDNVVADFVARGNEIGPKGDDWLFMDIFDHVITRTLNRMEADRAFGVPDGPVSGAGVSLQPQKDRKSIRYTMPINPIVVETGMRLETGRVS